MKNYFNEFGIGETDDIIVLVNAISKGTKKDGGSYEKLSVVDKSEMSVTIMNFETPVQMQLPCVARLRIEARDYQGNTSYSLIACQPEAEADITQYQPKAKINIQQAWNEMVGYITSIQRLGLQMVASRAITKEREKFLSLPFTKEAVFSRQSGLMEATLKLMRLAVSAANILELDRDLLIAGASVYYIGKTDTIDAAYQNTADDALVGLGIASANKVMETVFEIRTCGNFELIRMLDEEDVKLLCHILNSRCSGIKTAIPEAACLRYLDLILTETELIQNSLLHAGDGEVVNKIGTKQALYKKTHKEQAPQFQIDPNPQ